MKSRKAKHSIFFVYFRTILCIEELALKVLGDSYRLNKLCSLDEKKSQFQCKAKCEMKCSERLINVQLLRVSNSTCIQVSTMIKWMWESSWIAWKCVKIPLSCRFVKILWHPMNRSSVVMHECVVYHYLMEANCTIKREDR